MFNRLTDEELVFAGVRAMKNYLKMSSRGKEDAQQIFSRAIADAQCLSDEKQALEEMIEWGDSSCPHGYPSRGYCIRCWEELELEDRLEELKK